jgi:hypothetical protein
MRVETVGKKSDGTTRSRKVIDKEVRKKEGSVQVR